MPGIASPASSILKWPPIDSLRPGVKFPPIGKLGPSQFSGLQSPPIENYSPEVCLAYRAWAFEAWCDHRMLHAVDAGGGPRHIFFKECCAPIAFNVSALSSKQKQGGILQGGEVLV